MKDATMDRGHHSWKFPFLSKAYACSMILIMAVLTVLANAQQQQPPTAATSQPGGRVVAGQSQTSIGDSGFTVTIPEFKMKNIVGPPRQSEPAGPAKEEEPASQPEKIVPQPDNRTPRQVGPVRGPEPSTAQPAQVEESPSVEAPRRLPFEPPTTDRTIAPMDPPVNREPASDIPPPDISYPEQRPLTPSIHNEPASVVPPVEDVGKEDQSSFLKPPKAPEDLARDLAPPRKALMTRKPFPTVPILEDHPAKPAARAVLLEHLEHRDGTEKESISLDPRRAPEILPAPEVEVLPAKEVEALPAKEVPERPETLELNLPVQKPEPKEDIPSVKPLVEPPSLPAKESISSPLEESALHSHEVMVYLRETAPILEELSVLMTRAPSLAIADYDPSEPNTAVVPKEITLKMDSLKRDLQILDSKTFAIIPPVKYTEFHSLIRQSIAETYQACDAILGFINEADPTNLKKADEHIFKSRELMQRTREASYQG